MNGEQELMAKIEIALGPRVHRPSLNPFHGYSHFILGTSMNTVTNYQELHS